MDQPLPSETQPASHSARPVERLFPFLKRARVLLVGRDTLERSKSKLQFLLVTSDISDNSKAAILETFKHYPVIQTYHSDDLDRFFSFKNTKVIGFSKSSLAKSVYQELKQFRINKSLTPAARLPADRADAQ